ncbi:MAG: hydantoinase/oxoprolinase family protein [Rhodospirillaceae bacterium]|nr:hydantoinase/oxoprolinase family protein [Rhodospirillaceae bacterium]
MTGSLGSDIGGTFTDFALVDDTTGDVRIHKCLTTPDDPSAAVTDGIRAFGEDMPEVLGNLAYHIHGTTLVINAVIERKGAKTGLIVTKGTRDVLEIGREKRYDGYDLKIGFPDPLVPRPRRLEIDERLHAGGDVVIPLDEAGVNAAVQSLRDQGVASIAVCLLHAYRNSEHERRVGEIIAKAVPDIPVSLSSDVLPEMKEYERTSTTVVNAYAKPAAGQYLNKLSERMIAAGAKSELLLMLSSGGTTTAATAREFPVQIIESGPAAGALGAAHYARLAGLDAVLSFDMGGTTAKMCLVNAGRVAKTTEFEVAHVHRFKRGSGIPVHIPVVDLMEIGAGGGSIARVTEVGTLQVGPESSGAQPGPACYGAGGTEPTVSDADLLLGYLDADHFLGGGMALDVDAARAAIENRLAGPLKLGTEEAAWGVHSIVNENMASAAKVYVTERGEDPARYTMVAFGGAGPVHAVDFARRLGLKRVLIPPHAGVASALGMIVAPISFDTVRTLPGRLSQKTAADLQSLFDEMAAECLSRMPADIDTDALSYDMSVDMRYVGQGYHVNIPIPDDALGDSFPGSITEAFGTVYTKLYGRVYDDLELEVVNLRLSASTPTRIGDFGKAAADGADATPHRERQAYCPQADGYVPHAIYRRDTLGVGFNAKGPMIIEEDESTTIAGTGCTVSVDGHGSLVIDLE